MSGRLSGAGRVGVLVFMLSGIVAMGTMTVRYVAGRAGVRSIVMRAAAET